MQITTYSLIAILISCFFPYFWTGYAKISGKGYNNSTTRDSVEKFTGKRRRAHFAHLNSFEALPFFLVAVLIANINQVAPSTIHALAFAHVAFRFIYGWLYIADYATARSIVWFFAVLCNVALIIAAIP